MGEQFQQLSCLYYISKIGQIAMELRICDFRNAKYQGETIQKQPAGFGFALDENYTFVISEWAEGDPIGPITAIFDDSSKLYGDTGERDGALVYLNNQFRAFRGKRNIVVDCFNAKYLLRVEENKMSTPTARERGRVEAKWKVVAEKRYDDKKYLEILTEMLGGELPSRYQSYQNYIKQTFKPRNRDLLNIFESSKQFTLSLKNDSIYIKMSKKKDRILSCGFTGTEKKTQIGRRYSYYRDETSCVIEEFIQTQPSTFVEFQRCQENCKDGNAIMNAVLDIGGSSPIKRLNLNEKEKEKGGNEGSKLEARPKQCLKNLREYYKRSLTFLNKYLNLTPLYSQRSQFEQLFKTLKSLHNGKYAQIQLENDGYKLDQNDVPIITSQNQPRPKEYNLEDWKKELDRTTTGLGRREREKSPIKVGNWGYEEMGRSRERVASPRQSNVRINTVKDNQYAYTPVKDKDRSRRLNPQNQTAKADRSKSHKQLKYLDSETEAQKQGTYVQPKYENTRSSAQYKDTGSLYKGNQRRTPISYKFKYTDSDLQNEDPKYRLEPTNYKASTRRDAPSNYTNSNYNYSYNY